MKHKKAIAGSFKFNKEWAKVFYVEWGMQRERLIANVKSIITHTHACTHAHMFNEKQF